MDPIHEPTTPPQTPRAEGVQNRRPDVSEERFRDLLESVDAIIWEADAATLRLTYVSQGVEKILGFSPEEWLGTPNFWADHLHPEDRERGLRCEQEVKEKGQPLTVEYRMKGADGGLRWFWDSMHLCQGPEGNPKHLRGIIVDITESKRREVDLRRSEQRYRDFVARTSEGVWCLEFEPPVPLDLPEEEVLRRFLHNARFAETNLAHARNQGFSGPEAMVGKTLRDGAPLLDSDQERLETFRSAIRGGFRNRTVEFRGLDRTGDLKHFVRVEVPLVEKGLLKEMWGITRDVTALKRTEEALKASEERFRATFENAGIGMAILDLQGHLIMSNPASQKMIGYTAEELRAMVFTEFTHPDDQELDMGLYRELQEGKRDKYEIDKRLLRKDGQVVWGHLIASLVKDKQGRPQYGLGMVEDITERKQAEEQVRMLSRAVEQSPACVVITDPQGSIEYVNPKFTQLTGYTLEEALGKNPRLLKSGLTPAATYRQLWDTVLRGGEWHGEFANKKKNGDLYWESASITPIKDSQGLITHLVAVKEDITERKRAEAELTDRLRFETLLADLLARFVNVTGEKLDSEIEAAQRRVCEHLGLETSTLWQVSIENSRLVALTHVYGLQDGPPIPKHMDAQDYFPWCYEQLLDRRRNVIALSSLEGLPSEMTRDRESWLHYGTKSAIIILLTGEGGLPIGALSFNTRREERSWPQEIVNRLQVVAQMFSNALARQRSDRALQESEARFRGLFEHATLGIYRTTPAGRIILANPALVRMLGYEKFDELAERNLETEGFEPDYPRTAFRERIEKEGVVQSLEAAWRRRDGSVMLVRESAWAIRGADGQVTSYDGIVEDITERKRAEEFTAMLKQSIDVHFDGVYWTDCGNRFIYINDAGCRALGYERSELMGKALSDVNPLATPERLGQVWEVLRSKGVFSTESVHRRKDGTEFPVEIVTSHVQFGGREYACGFARDITERKRGQRELQQSLDQVRALAGRLESIREEESQRLSRELHDQLGQALTALRLDVMSLIGELPGGAQPWSEKASAIMKLADEMVETVRRLSMELRPTMLDHLGLAPTIEWAVEQFEMRTGIKCKLDLAEESLAIEPERATAIYRILQELLTNVARHASASELDVQLVKRGHDVVLTVQDNGKGMPAEEASSLKSLGLLGMRERALMFGGEVVFCSPPGMGTTVWVRIPVAHQL